MPQSSPLTSRYTSDGPTRVQICQLPLTGDCEEYAEVFILKAVSPRRKYSIVIVLPVYKYT
jgi:hypothetical protein